MADENDPFASIDLGSTDTPPAGAESQTKPFTSVNRLIAQTFFDTQPKRRAAYLKRLGYELDPQDPNKMKPIGEPGKYYLDIDPGGMFDLKQYLDQYRAGAKEGGAVKGATRSMTELNMDLMEGAIDLMQGAFQEGVSDVAALGAAAGAVASGAGAPVSPLVALGTRSASRALIYQFIENSKDALGNLFLDEAIPADQGLRATQTAIQAVAPEILGKATKVGLEKATKGLGATLNLVQNGFKNLLNIGGGNVDDIVLKGLAKDPKTFADMSKLEQGGDFLQNNFINPLTGTADENVPKNFFELGKDSLFKKKMATLESEKGSALTKLDSISGSGVKASDIISTLKNQIDSIMAKRTRGEDDKLLVEALQERIKEVAKSGPRNFTFREADQFVDQLQKDAYKGQADYKQGLKFASGSINRLLKDSADTVDAQLVNAGQQPVNYRGINEAQSKIYNAFDSFSANVNRKNVLSTIVAGPLGALNQSTPRGVTANQMSQAIAEIDDALGTKFGEQVQTGQAQAQLFRAIQSGKIPRGAGGFLTSGGLAAATTAAATGGNVPLSLAAGVAGGLAGQPSVGLRAVGGLANSQQVLQGVDQGVQSAIEGALTRSTPAAVGSRAAAGQLAKQPAVQQPIQNVNQSLLQSAGAVEEDDPFAEIDFSK